MCQLSDNAIFLSNKDNQILYLHPAVETNDRLGMYLCKSQ